VGTSGGVWALERDYCMVAGGEADTVKYLDPIFATLASGCIMFNTFLSNLCQKTQGLRELDWGGERWHFDLALRFSS
jgi:6-phosphogluconate dehydrogenase (decarboxylating)